MVSTIKGFRMPAEFEEHSATLLLWPERCDVWRGGAKPAQQAVADLAKEISAFEPVVVGVTAGQYMNARNMLPNDISVFEISYDDAWIRDTAPTLITDGIELRGVDWIFNAWGGIEEGSYFPWMLDDLVARKIIEWFGAKRYRMDIVLEGGAIHVDGEGTLIAIESCVLNKNRNPNKRKEEIEEKFHDFLGVTKVIWLKRGLYLEENNGHIDNMCAFVRPGEVVLAWCDDEEDPQYEISREAYEILSDSLDARGRKLTIHKLPMPKPLYMSDEESSGLDKSNYALERNAGDRLPASYVNFYFVNGGVIVPKFSCDMDEQVMRLYKRIFYDRRIIPVNVREFLLGGGGVHCMTTQIPQCAQAAWIGSRIQGISPKSVVTPKVVVKESVINGIGMFAKQAIKKDEVVYIKGGHILTQKEVYSSSVINSYLPIDDNYYIAAILPEEEEKIKLYNNHSCNPNCGMRGDVTFVAIRDIECGEELTIDYAMIDNEDYKFECHCGEENCRGIVTGKDWRIKGLQKKYGKYFASYLKEKIQDNIN